MTEKVFGQFFMIHILIMLAGMTLMAGTQLDLSGKGWECPNKGKDQPSKNSQASNNKVLHNQQQQQQQQPPSSNAAAKVKIITPTEKTTTKTAATAATNGNNSSMDVAQKDQRIKARLSKQGPVEDQCSK